MAPSDSLSQSSGDPVTGKRLSDSEISKLLANTSRTFALTIPLLGQPLRRYVGAAYLLFRIADTIEDSCTLSQSQKRDLFVALDDALTSADTGVAESSVPAALRNLQVTDNQHESVLLHQVDSVLATVKAFPKDAGHVVLDCVQRSAAGMKRFVSSGDQGGNVRLKSMVELREYCYSVAGIVGEMLTELFLQQSRIPSVTADRLRELAPVFGEALQLVNIVKDDEADEKQGRKFIPPGVTRDFLIQLARHDLRQSEHYIEVLHQSEADRGILRFCELPVRLATRALERVEEDGPGAKVSRLEVAGILAAVMGPRRPFTN